MVIVEEPHLFRGLTEVQEPEVQRISRLLPPRVALDPQTARALSVYVSNRKRISASRRAEIARHLAEPWRLRLGLPPATPYDALLCALYAHNFLSDSQARA